MFGTTQLKNLEIRKAANIPSVFAWILTCLLFASFTTMPLSASQRPAGQMESSASESHEPSAISVNSTGAQLSITQANAAVNKLEARELTGFLDDQQQLIESDSSAPEAGEDGSSFELSPMENLPVIDSALMEKIFNENITEPLRIIVHLDYLPHAQVFADVNQQYQLEIDMLEADRQAFLQQQSAKRDFSTLLDSENYVNMFVMDKVERKALRSINERNEQLSTEIKREVSSRLSTLLAANQAPVVSEITRLGGHVEFTTIAGNTIVATIPAGVVESLSVFPGVMRIVEDSMMEGYLDNADRSTMVDPEDGALSGLWDNGQTGGIYDPATIDSGLDMNHPGMVDKTGRTNFFSWYLVAGVGSASFGETCCSIDDFQGHGSHVAGIVGSYGTGAYPGHLGMAFGVEKLVTLKAGWLNSSTGGSSMFWSDKFLLVDRALNDTPALSPNNFTDDVDGMNLSYGSETTLDDTDGGRFWDSVISSYSDLPVTIAAGNSGPSNTLFSDPAVSYNVITVANLDDRGTASRADDIIRFNSTRGPTASGRRKPDIAAPGTSISAPNHLWESASDYVNKSGTSMAAPMVLGVIMDLMDAGMLDELAIKAVLINTAQKNLPGMNFESDPDGWDPGLGWGAMNAYAAYFHRSDVFQDTLAPRDTSGDFQLYKGVMVDEGAAGEGRDRATMVWNRHATYNPGAAPGTYYTLTDLNLRLYSESNNVLIDFDTTGSDNVQQVRIGAGAPATDVIINAYAWSTTFAHGGSTESIALATEDGFTRVDHPTTFQGLALWPASVEPNEVFDYEFWIRNDSDIASHNNSFNLELPVGWTLLSGVDTVSVGSAPAGGITAHYTWTLRAPATEVGAQTITVKHSHNSYNEPYGAFNWNAGLTVEVDNTPPNPNPMSFSTLPNNVSSSQINMTASFATDIHLPVEYYLDYTSSPSGNIGGSDSGWQASRVFLDDNLQENGEYCYRAWARDNAQTPNNTTPSAITCVYTSQSVPGGVAIGTITNNSIGVSSTTLPGNLTLDLSGLKIANLTNASDSGWKQNNDPWISNPLTPATAYTFVALARNGDGEQTANSASTVAYTLANFPAVNSLVATSRSEIHVDLNANGNSGQAEYLIENTTSGSNSGWISDTSWTSAGLACNTSYNFQARARNGDGVETIIVPFGAQTTGSCALPCPVNLNLVNQVLTGTHLFEASGNITTQGVSIAASADISFVAGQTVDLGNMTSTATGAVFSVQTGTAGLTCTPP